MMALSIPWSKFMTVMRSTGATRIPAPTFSGVSACLIARGPGAVLGTIRYMSFNGMRRKTGVDAYIHEMEHLERTP